MYKLCLLNKNKRGVVLSCSPILRFSAPPPPSTTQTKKPTVRIRSLPAEDVCLTECIYFLCTQNLHKTSKYRNKRVNFVEKWLPCEFREETRQFRGDIEVSDCWQPASYPIERLLITSQTFSCCFYHQNINFVVIEWYLCCIFVDTQFWWIHTSDHTVTRIPVESHRASEISMQS